MRLITRICVAKKGENMPRSKKKITAQNKKPEPGRAANGMGSLRQKTVKGNTYWVGRFSVRDSETGKLKQHSVSGKNKTEVEKRLRKALVEAEEGTYVEPSKMTVGQWLDIWLETYLSSVRPYTVLSYTQHVNNHIKPALGEIRLDKLHTHSIQQFYNRLGMANGDKPGLSPKTVQNIHGVLHKALQQAVKIGYLRINASDACELPRAEKTEIKPLSEEEIQTFMKTIKGHKFETVFLVLMFTGIRRGEVCGLTWDHVNFERNTIYINRQLQQIPGQSGVFQLTPTKSGKGRTITAAAFVMDALRQYKVQQTEARLKAGPDWQDEGFVFTNHLGRHLSPNTVYNNYKRLMASIGLPQARLHDLRHTYATISLDAGDDIKTVQENLGHHTAAFTLSQYAHSTEKMKTESAARMDQFIKGVSGA